ncbi:hypothetical protein L7F22_043708 [Adiantum nelumboides]|nr:hypothetical protein [Adiantum nelumboides]
MSSGQNEASSSSTPSSRLGSLSASLNAHLSKPVAPSTASDSASIHSITQQGFRPPKSTQNGKASPIAAGSASLVSNSELWRSSAARRAEKAWAVQSEKTLQSDAKFKKYAIAVEKCLATFDSVSEWADFISFLARLLKTLQTSTQFNAIPRKLIVAKRLSQCLNPALPSGVHQRALEVYEHIFTVIGPEGLRRDLSVWTPGLLPFFQFASMTVKPIVLNIIELHYLPLGQDLRPIAKPMQLALLPGLEEETSEHFERVLKLLDKIRDSIGQPFFLQNLWMILISVPAARLPSLHYLSRRLDDLNGAEGAAKEVTSIVGPDLGLAIRAFSAALEDDTLLVRRAMLDLLAVKFKLDSKTFKELVRQDDRIRLFQSALAVVLRRDISLNRRLYAWLLGPSEDITAQQAYFEQHAMQYARLALLSAFNEENEDGSQGYKAESKDRQKPYRILISLLDKWSLGLPITNALIIDTFKALRKRLQSQDNEQQSKKAASSDVSTTAKMLFEAVDPFALYRQFYLAICEEIKAKGSDDVGKAPESESAIALLRFIFTSFRVHDEESRVVHLPILFSAIVELVQENPTGWQASAGLQLARDILTLIPKRVFGNRLADSTAASATSTLKTKSFYEHGLFLYQATSGGADEAAKRYIGFQHPSTISALLDTCASIPERRQSLAVDSLTILCQLLNILDATFDASQTQASISWNGNLWIEQMKTQLHNAKSFIGLEACIEAFVAGSQCRVLKERISIDQEDITTAIVERLFDFMQPASSPYHVRSVELLWTIFDLSPSTQIGAILTRSLNGGTLAEREDALETFNTIWRYSDDVRLSSPLLVDPLLSVLDGLLSTDWNERQLAETWGALCSVNSIAIGFSWRPSLARTLRTAQVQRSTSKKLASFASSEPEKTYTYFIFEILLSLLKSDATAQSAYQSAHESIHALAVDIIGALLGKVHIGETQLKEIENVLLQRLLLDIREGIVSVQGKLLRTLHGIFVGTHGANARHGQQAASSPPTLLLSTLKAGLSAPKNQIILTEWSDFVLAISPIFRSSLNGLLLPLNQGLCALIRSSVAELEQAYGIDTQDDVTCLANDNDLITLMTMSERVLSQSLEQQASTGASDSGNAGSNAEKGEFSLLGALSSVFSADSSTADSFGASANNAVWKSLHQTVMTLHLAWISTSAMPTNEDSRHDTMEVIRKNVQARCRRYLEKLYRNHSGEVVEALIACWSLATRSGNEKGTLGAFDILTFLAPSAQIVVTFLCDVISTRTSSTSSAEKPVSGNALNQNASTRSMSSPGLPDSILLSFLEAYLLRLDSEATIQVWPVVSIFVKDILGNTTQHKAQIFPTLRCLTIIGEKVLDERDLNSKIPNAVAGGIGGDDRRLRRDLIDLYSRICDLNILIGGRSFEQTTWIGRRTVTSDPDQDDAAVQKGLDEKMSGSIGDLASSSTTSTAEAVQTYLAKKVLPALRSFSIDTDKLIGLCTNVVYYIISPSLKVRKKSLDLNPTLLSLIVEVTKLPGTYKAWRAPIGEYFNDPRFFETDVDVGVSFTPIIFAFMTGDKERFIETIGRVSPPSTNIFTNREAETRMRALNIRRMSYVLYSSPKDYWLTQLPLIQEKLVDLLRNSANDPAISEVYLCLRILLIRFESKHLNSFWPVVITEMMRLFESCLEELPSDGSDQLSLVEGACRFLDLLVTLQTDEFQIHQWLFITDTVDIVYPPDDWAPESILDRLATAINERRSVAQSGSGNGVATRRTQRKVQTTPRLASKSLSDQQNISGIDEFMVPNTKRKPLLLDEVRGSLELDGNEHSVETIEDLQAFFANISLHSFESTYASGDAVDWDLIEKMLQCALFQHSDV